MTIRRSISLFFITISFTYFFLIYSADAKQIITPFEQPIYDERSSKSLSNLICGEKFLEEVQTSNSEYLDIFEEHSSALTTKLPPEIEFQNRSSVDEHLCRRVLATELPSEIKLKKKSTDVNLQLKDDKIYGFYTSIGGGRIFYDNSEVFVEGIKAIGERVQDLIKEDSYLSAFVKRIIAKEVDDINKFKGTIDFQWLSSSSLGYHVKENGRVDFEIMYSQISIKNSSDTPVFDKSASILALLLNMHYSPTIKNAKFAPYVGLGIGSTIFRLKKFSKSLQNPIPLNVPWFAYKAKLGVDYSIIPEMNLFLDYRYFSIPIPVADDITTHSIEVGLRFNF